MVIKTEFGTGYIKDGYIRISSIKQGNHGQYLHRLVYEKHHGKLSDGMVVHHKNGNKLDNSLDNLIAIPLKEHVHHHVSGKNNPLYGKSFTKEHREKLSHAKKGLVGINSNHSKYTLWDSACAILEKNRINPNHATRCFKLNYKSKKLPVGMFNEWVSCEIINKLIGEAIP